MKKMIILLFVAIAVGSVDAQITCVPQFRNGPYGSYVTIAPQNGTPPFELSVNNGVDWSSNLSFFAPYGEQCSVVVRDQNGLIGEINMNRDANYFRTNFDPANLEVGDQTISISGSQLLIQNGVVFPLNRRDTIIARPSSGWIKIIQDPMSMIDTFLLFDTNTIHDTIPLVKIVEPRNTNVSIYPNPTVGPLNISAGAEGIGIAQVTIFNTLSQKVKEDHNLGNKAVMDLTALPKGTYAVCVTLNDGRESVHKVTLH